MSKRQKAKFPFHTVIENGYCAIVDVNEEGDVIITVGFGNKKQAKRWTDRLRGRHKYE